MYGFSVSGGVAAGPCPAMKRYRELVKKNTGNEPLFIENAFTVMAAMQKLKCITLPERIWEVLENEGGSLLGNSKPGMPKAEEDFEIIRKAILELGISKLTAVGGDDSGKTLSRLSGKDSKFNCILIPKTIDWDVNLPGDAYTLGTQSCAYYGAQNVIARMVNARMLNRNYMTICMGRHSGRLPWLLYSKVKELPGLSHADLLLTKEFFKPETNDIKVNCSLIASIVVGSRLKLEEKCKDREIPIAHGVIFGENLVTILPEDDFDNIRVEDGRKVLADARMDKALSSSISSLLKKLNRPDYTKVEQMGVVPRGKPPIKADIELAYGLTDYAFELHQKGISKQVVYQDSKGVFQHAPFSVLTKEDGSSATKLLNQEKVEQAKNNMLVLKPKDLESPRIGNLAKRAGVSVEEFKEIFTPAVKALFS